ELGRCGRRMKEMHRLVTASATDCHGSAPPEGLEAGDPDNRFLSHYPLRRLDAEAVRDSVLQISGELDPRSGGPYVASKRTPEGIVEVPENEQGARRRSIYLQQRRTQVVTFRALFDAPSVVTPRRK